MTSKTKKSTSKCGQLPGLGVPIYLYSDVILPNGLPPMGVTLTGFVDTLSKADSQGVPTIALVTKIAKDNGDPLASKFDSVPYIDKNSVYPTKNNKPMICVAQLNMDQIFSFLKSKKTDKYINQYFKYLPHRGILQFYRPNCEPATNNSIKILYIKKYNVENHDIKKASSLKKIYRKYIDKYGYTLECDIDNDVGSYIYVTDALYAYDFVNSSMNYHDAFAGNSETKYLGTYGEQEDTIHIGGYPYHVQDPAFEFENENDFILLNIVNSLIGFNIGVKIEDLGNLDFDHPLVDIAY